MGIVELTDERLEYLERSKGMNPYEKVNILSLLLHLKWITDFPFIDKEQFKRLEPELDCLALPYFKDFYVYEDGSEVEWLQVAANQRILEYLKERKEVLTAVEAGIMYGYPASAVLAFEGVLRGRIYDPSHKNVVSFYLGGVYSVDLYSDERREMIEKWEMIEKVSPSIARDAIDYMQSTHPAFTDEKA